MFTLKMFHHSEYARGLATTRATSIEPRYQGNREPDSKMADSVQVEETQRRAVGGTITTGRIHKG